MNPKYVNQSYKLRLYTAYKWPEDPNGDAEYFHYGYQIIKAYNDFFNSNINYFMANYSEFGHNLLRFKVYTEAVLDLYRTAAALFKIKFAKEEEPVLPKIKFGDKEINIFCKVSPLGLYFEPYERLKRELQNLKHAEERLVQQFKGFSGRSIQTFLSDKQFAPLRPIVKLGARAIMMSMAVNKEIPIENGVWLKKKFADFKARKNDKGEDDNINVYMLMYRSAKISEELMQKITPDYVAQKHLIKGKESSGLYGPKFVNCVKIYNDLLEIAGANNIKDAQKYIKLVEPKILEWGKKKPENNDVANFYSKYSTICNVVQRLKNKNAEFDELCSTTKLGKDFYVDTEDGQDTFLAGKKCRKYCLQLLDEGATGFVKSDVERILKDVTKALNDANINKKYLDTGRWGGEDDNTYFTDDD